MTENPLPQESTAPEAAVGKDSRPFPGFWQGLGLSLLPTAFGCVLAVPIVILKLTGLMKTPETLMPLMQALCFLPVLWVGFRLTQKSWREVFPLGRPRWGLVPAFLLAQAGVTILVMGVDAVWGRLLPEPKALGEMMKSMGPIALVLVAPLTEEPLCRGLILGGLLARYPKGKAILFSALIFAIMHLNPWQFFPPLMLGLLYGWVVTETRSLWFPILGHLLHNGIFALGMKVSIPGLIADGRLLPGWMWLAGLVIGAAGLSMLRCAFATPAVFRGAKTT